MSVNERSGWRDLWISKRHRMWGFNCPGVDLDAMVTEHGAIVSDFLVSEYDHGMPVAIVDYKRKSDFRRDSSTKALGNLRNTRGKDLPFFVACYSQDYLAYTLHSENEAARDAFETIEIRPPKREQHSDVAHKKVVRTMPRHFSEIEFVYFLYCLRYGFPVTEWPSMVKQRLRREEVSANLLWLRKTQGIDWKAENFPSAPEAIRDLRKEWERRQSSEGSQGTVA